MRIAPIVIIATGLAFGFAAEAQDSTPAPVVFEIDQQPLADALAAFAKQAKLQVIQRDEHVSTVGMMAPRLYGKLTAREALTQLLANTGLKFEFINERTVTIRSVKSGDKTSSNLNPADQMRVAVVEDAEEKEKKSEESSDDSRQVTVKDKKIRPYSDGNVDIPRTINDAQPYYIFDAATLDRSGASSIEDFLKQRLTMNALALANGETSGLNYRGNTSTIDLRGVGRNKTLILVNGRRMPGVKTLYTEEQPDLNGIPLNAIERIEVMPSSASGIYGGSAIGGVINVILKHDYVGGQARASYDNPTSGSAPRRSLSASYGLTLEEGRTHLGFNASWSESKGMLLQDRASIFRDNLAAMQSRNPNFIYSRTNPWLGAVPNIVPVSSLATTLTLKNNGTPLAINSRNTYVPAGTSPTTSMAVLSAALLANAGQWNLDFPLSTQSPSGLLRPFGFAPETKSIQAGVRRQMLPKVELFADFSYNDTPSESIYNFVSASLTVPAATPTNPFNDNVRMRVPDAGQVPLQSRSQNRSVTLGALVQLPRGWTGAWDYTWSENRFNHLSYTQDNTLNADLVSGALNPFVDTLLYPLDFQKYYAPFLYEGSNRLQGIVLRGSGPLPALPWGVPNLTVGLEHRLSHTPERTSTIASPIDTRFDAIQTFYARDATTDSAYLEVLIPLVKSATVPALHALEFQASGRGERYEVDTGTPAEYLNYTQTPPTTAYAEPTLNGAPFFSRATYTSKNYTLGLKYQPLEEVTFRVSRATAFLPPAPEQLLANPTRFDSIVIDPLTELEDEIQILMGGNPDLTPQNSTSLNAGVIWEPTWSRLKGLRLNAEYYKIEQFDAIANLSEQVIVNLESSYPDRVVRNSSGDITLVDISLMNLYHRETEGWDLTADYGMDTSVGHLSLHAVGSIIKHLKNQYAQDQPEYEAAGYNPYEEGAPKYKSNVSLTLERQQWMAGWTTRYFGSYKAYTAAGGPSSMQFYNGGSDTSFIAAQGGDTIRSQMYHDLFLSYAFDDGVKTAGTRLLSGLTLQFGMRNLLNKVPPLDVIYASNYYLSPFGDKRLRTYWFNATKTF